MYDVMSSAPDSIKYVVTGYTFWQAMGWTSAIGMVIGRLMYNGDLKRMHKFFISFAVYLIFLIYTQLARIHGLEQINNPIQASASIITILFVSFFYVFGMYLGVTMFSIIKKRGIIEKRKNI